MCCTEGESANQHRQAYSSFENLKSPSAERLQVVLEESSEKELLPYAGKDKNRQEIFQKRSVFHQRMSLYRAGDNDRDDVHDHVYHHSAKDSE